MQTLTLPYPDDWHCHLRDSEFLARTVADESQRFARAIIMPNLTPPITTVAMARDYEARILQAVPASACFTPLMTLYLNSQLAPEEIELGKKSDLIKAVKLYPAGATTHSEAGVKEIASVKAQLSAMQDCGLPLLVHGESVNESVDILRREQDFILNPLTEIINEFPKLPIVLEHISTKEAVEFIQQAPNHVGATITPHHLLLNLNDLLANGIRPHYYCKPVLKQRADQTALIAAATSGNRKFFLGTDSAPHARGNKETSCGCAGVYSAHAAIELYAEVFEKHNALDKLADFAARFGPEFYGLPVNTKTLTLIKKPWTVSATLKFGTSEIVPLFAGETLNWQIKAK